MCCSVWKTPHDKSKQEEDSEEGESEEFEDTEEEESEVLYRKYSK